MGRARYLVFLKDDPPYCHFALSRETVCFRIVLNKDSNAQREKNHLSFHLRCSRLVLWQLEFFFLMLVFIITLPNHFVWCLGVLMNHSSIVISDGFGEASSMLVPVSCLLVLQPATGSHQSCIGINRFTFPYLTYLLSGSVWLLSFLGFPPSSFHSAVPLKCIREGIIPVLQSKRRRGEMTWPSSGNK